MDYFYSVIDSNGFVHSVDMVIVDYYLNCNYHVASREVIAALSALPDFDESKNSSLGNTPNFKYQYYVDMVWYDGFVIHLGKYGDYDKDTKKWREFDMVRVKVNPNKHLVAGKDSVFSALLPFIRGSCREGRLVRWDYAIDIPLSPDAVSVVGSRKEKGLYKGTRYYGQRHKHGYLKIYNKQLEQRLESPLTRLEYTFQGGLPPSWDNIHICTFKSVSGGSMDGLRSARLYLDMLLEIKALGGDIEPFIERMDNRTFKKIEPFLFTGEQLRCDDNIIDKLLSVISDTFIIADIEQLVNDNVIPESSDFVPIETDLPLPF